MNDKKPKFEVEIVHEYDHAEYFRGHGHGFDKGLIACVPAITPLVLDETVGELKDRILEQYNQSPYWCGDQVDERIRAIPNSEIRKYLHALFGDPKFDNDNVNILLGLSNDLDSDYSEWFHYVYFHFYEVSQE